MPKVLGEGIFSAYRQDGIAHLSAIGQKPSPQTKVTIDQLPFLIYPPRFALMFETDGITNPLVMPFDIDRAIPNYPPDVKFISVMDKNGLHAIDILDLPATGNGGLIDDPNAAIFAVFRQINGDQYLIAKADSAILAIFIKVFGPDTYANCQAYVAAHAVVTPPSLAIAPGALNAWIDRQPGPDHGPKLIVTVDVIVEIDWTVSLVSAVPQGINPLVKLLKFDIVLPPGPVHSNAMMKKTFRYEEAPPQNPYTDVTIENATGSNTAPVRIIV
ncbi:hypothetical protein [Bradyrhizobium sp. S69]|uniref:hypothetical protein n=1 Tax=Bradyrhizobium sp. S69 TaxID=1641856 RepID=UPI00131EB917|nr:hypothetical protein [Bradyrhizobium sp. S69]